MFYHSNTSSEPPELDFPLPNIKYSFQTMGVIAALHTACLDNHIYVYLLPWLQPPSGKDFSILEALFLMEYGIFLP